MKLVATDMAVLARVCSHVYNLLFFKKKMLLILEMKEKKERETSM